MPIYRPKYLSGRRYFSPPSHAALIQRSRQERAEKALFDSRARIARDIELARAKATRSGGAHSTVPQTSTH